jgi:hypothetical protein
MAYQSAPELKEHQMPQIESSPRKISANPLLAKVREYLTYKKKIDELSKSQSEIKNELMEEVENNGVEDDKGHLWLELPEEVDGYVSLQRQRRVSQKLDMDAAVVLLATKGLADRCIKALPTVDEDEVMACLYEGKLSEKDIDTMFPKTVTWAFVPSKK